MKAIMISDKPRWCAKIMNGEKTIEVRKNKALETAIQKLINEYGYADIYVYCSKSNYLGYISNKYVGKVIFKFRCYKIDDYVYGKKWSWKIGAPLDGISNDYEYILKDTCLTDDELRNYADDLCFNAIHISDLEIFDKPKELSEFYKIGFEKALKESLKSKPYPVSSAYIEKQYQLTKAPQNFCYVEVE